MYPNVNSEINGEIASVLMMELTDDEKVSSHFHRSNQIDVNMVIVSGTKFY